MEVCFKYLDKDEHPVLVEEISLELSEYDEDESGSNVSVEQVVNRLISGIQNTCNSRNLELVDEDQIAIDLILALLRGAEFERIEIPIRVSKKFEVEDRAEDKKVPDSMAQECKEDSHAKDKGKSAKTFCPFCGILVDSECIFCHNCGAYLEELNSS
jgi:hypothetical protein